MREIKEKSGQWNDRTMFKQIKAEYRQKWEMLFDLAKLGDMERPLSARILSSPSHPITKHILYLYSMESFIYADLNKACREQDKAMIQYYGAYAAALSFIINNANRNRRRNKLDRTTILYRGIKLKEEEVDDYEKGVKINLLGYTSTSRRFDNALQFAFMELPEDKVPVVFEIRFSGQAGLFEMTEDVTAFPDESEVLVQDGLEYLIVNNIEKAVEDEKYRLIQLAYPADQ